jgi:fumiquinazoline A oxidase
MCDSEQELNTSSLFENYYTTTALNDAVNNFTKVARARFQETSGFDELSVYLNFAHGDEGVNAWYSARKMPRLSALKRLWDPEQLFSWNFPIPLFYL